jgi:hypothetical protein
MSTKRRPKRHDKTDGTITPQAVEIFKAMTALPDCLCAISLRPPCRSCDQWWALHSRLHGALKLRSYQWPAIESPCSTNSWQKNTAASVWFAHAQQLYRDLAAAAAAP